MFKKLLYGLAGLAFLLGPTVKAEAGTTDSQGYPVMYLRGSFNGLNWSADSKYKFTRSGNNYSLTINNSNAMGEGEFKIADDNWDIYNLGADVTINSSQYVTAALGGGNMKTDGLNNAVISFTYDRSHPMTTQVKFVVNGIEPSEPSDPSDDHPDVYLRGTMSGNTWPAIDKYKFTYKDGTYTLDINSSNSIPADSEFKIGNEDWTLIDLGGQTTGISIAQSQTLTLVKGGQNLKVTTDVTSGSISFKDPGLYPESAEVTFSINGIEPSPNPQPNPDPKGLSGTLPVLYINVYTDENHTSFNNEIINKDLNHKNYFDYAEYWLDVNGCQWMIDEGAQSVGSAEEPLKLQIKARGNYTRTGFSKKPFKLKLDKKQSLLGMSKNKHYAILAHADDNFGYLRNFVGFNLGKRIGLPWTPSQQPVEVVINGDYRGLYFLTESIRIDSDRVDIEELNDNETDPELISGGYIVELDNYDEPEDAQIQMSEKVANGVGNQIIDKLRITFDTPEVYSPLQRTFVTGQFTAMNNYVGSNSNDLWKYMDLDDAARYYIVEEIVSHTESYHGSTYLFRDRGEGHKWHFSPLWDFGNAFNGSTSDFFYNCDMFGNTWIPSMRQNSKFNDKVKETWKWFMSNEYDGIVADIDKYVSRITAAAQADYARWNNQPLPSNTGSNNPTPVVDNRNMQSRRNNVVNHLNSKINWLKGQFGDYTNGTFAEPARDTTPAAPLPDFSDVDDGSPKVYLRGTFVDGWAIDDRYKFKHSGNTYTLTINSTNPVPAGAEFKIATEDWNTVNLGGKEEGVIIDATQTITLGNTSNNLKTNNGISEGSITFTYTPGSTSEVNVTFTIAGTKPAPVNGVSGTLPVLYINVYTDENHTAYNNEIISKDLAHKDYFDYSEYWLDVNGCQWLIDEGAENVGSAEKPLALQIKARGNWTRIGFAKKPFKLKLDKKQSLLGMSKSKHYAILAHADDNKGYLRNYVGFNLGKRIGLPWTPSQQPVEVVINGDYRGLYFLTESIRVEEERVNIEELNDSETEGRLISGGYIVELDNYDEDSSAQIQMEEKVANGVWGHYTDKLRITFDTPEVYSDLQRRFVTEQFTAMNDYVGANNDQLWSYLDLDDAARYYLVEEIVSHTESFHGSTYLFRDRGEGKKWHFSPLWDFGNAFNGSTNDFFYNCDPYGNTWIPSLRQNKAFNDKVKATWLWFMSSKYPGLENDINSYVNSLKAAAQADRKRWNNQPAPSGGQPVADNSDMDSKKNEVLNHLNSKTSWLKTQFGNYSTGSYSEPQRDLREAAELPDYAKDTSTVIDSIIGADELNADAEYYNLQGMKVAVPVKGEIYIMVNGSKANKILIR